MAAQKIAVVTDSSAYIPKEAQGNLVIPWIPLWLHWDNDRFADGVDIDPPTFYQRLRNSKTFPTTSQPSAGEFMEFFKKAGEGFDAIVCVFLSSALSGTVANAQAAAREMPDLDIRIVDSKSVAMGVGFPALAAAKAATANASLDDVVAAAESVCDRMQLLFAVDTLEFLHRGGRMGGAQRLLGTALNIKPLLHFEDGRIEPLAKVRTKKKAIQAMLDVAEERLGGGKMAEVAVLDVDTPDEGDAVAEQVKERFGMDPVWRTTVTPAIGTHAGPGTVCLCYYPRL
ncbi:MAG: DegV family protein [Anaerolineales bacterium]|nr:MAG: DegV family protein [Anaerolineales bacterium]